MMDLWNYSYTLPVHAITPVERVYRIKRLQEQSKTTFRAVLRREYEKQMEEEPKDTRRSWVA